MGLFDRFKDMMSPDPAPDYPDVDDYLLDEEEEEMQYPGPQQMPQQDRQDRQDRQYPGPQYQQQRDIPPPQPVRQSVSSGSQSSLALRVFKPEKFENVPQIAEHLLNRKTIVLNLEDTNKETARRLIDFLSGVAYAIEGQIKRVGNGMFMVTPRDVELSSEPIRDESANRNAHQGETY